MVVGEGLRERSATRARYHARMVHAAYLRTYLPAARARPWQTYAGGSAASPRVLTVGEFAVWDESVREDAFTADWDGRRYVCPRHPRLRMLEGLLAFRNSYPGATAALLVPESIAARATAELESYRDAVPGARSHILTSPWHVPLRWFVAFRSEQRELIETPRGPSIRYRNSLADGLARVEHAVEVLEDVGFEDAIVDQVRELALWLGTFDTDAMIELDYGTVAALFAAGDIAFDETAADVHASLEALGAGNLEEAGRHYAAAATRWAELQTLAFAN